MDCLRKKINSAFQISSVNLGQPYMRVLIKRRDLFYRASGRILRLYCIEFVRVQFCFIPE